MSLPSPDPVGHHLQLNPEIPHCLLWQVMPTGSTSSMKGEVFFATVGEVSPWRVGETGGVALARVSGTSLNQMVIPDRFSGMALQPGGIR